MCANWRRPVSWGYNQPLVPVTYNSYSRTYKMSETAQKKKTSFINCLTVNCEVGASFYVCQRKERQQAVGTWQLPTGAVCFMTRAVLTSYWWLQGQFFKPQPYFVFYIRAGINELLCLHGVLLSWNCCNVATQPTFQGCGVFYLSCS